MSAANDAPSVPPALHAAILDALSAGIALVDAGGTLAAVNESWRRSGTDGSPAGSMFAAAGGNLLQILDQAQGPDADAFHAMATGLRQVLAGVEPGFIHQYISDHSAKGRLYRVMITPLPGVPGTGAVVLHLDITGHQENKAQFLHQQRLESIGTLASGIAHDLNNVLSPILMSIDILADEQMTHAQRLHILDGLRRSAQRGAAMVRQVLSFARGMEGQRVSVSSELLVHDLAEIIQETFPKGIRFKVEKADALWSVRGDSTQLHQALLNLCVNARDAMPQGGSLVLGAENKLLDESYSAMNPGARPGPYVVVRVTDTGTGIPPEIKDRIFDPFFTTKELGKGTGLGLSTVLAIVKGHQGFIRVNSEPGKGSSFEVHLPADGAKVEETPASGSVALSGEGELILVVDDEEVILDISRKTLEKRGYRVFTATEGATAVALYAQHGKDVAVVLTDMMMPIMDGITTLHALRRINPAVKVIAASGLSSNMNPAKMKDAGVRFFLHKPYRAETLLKTLREAIDSVPTVPSAN